MDGLRELDLVGLRLADRQAFLREVATHLEGLLYGGSAQETLKRIRQKHKHQREYARADLVSFEPRFMRWAPVVPRGPLTEGLAAIEGLQIVINGKYKRRVEVLVEKAKKERQLTGNPVFQPRHPGDFPAQRPRSSLRRGRGGPWIPASDHGPRRPRPRGRSPLDDTGCPVGPGLVAAGPALRGGGGHQS
ncbi:MAG: hypothetical protein AB1609_04295 [Bacillota bacterium]